ncbi:hypothetical protein HGRIS_013814 [Hohenbuehelia grisea]|uniref:Carbonic anhydrase n=1 Tax=Hohenbuehelia grisea TaxID=104357 RepID=A0ABR3IWM3_9AGAR
MDTRIDPHKQLGIRLGEAHILRNAGGAITADVIRSIHLSQTALGTREVAVFHHTYCGALPGTASASDTDAEKDADGNLLPSVYGDERAFCQFDQVEGSVKKSLHVLRTQGKLEPGTILTGWVYDVISGRVRLYSSSDLTSCRFLI